MRVYPTTLGGRPAKVYAPRVGELTWGRFRRAFPGGAVYGLDVESLAFSGAGHWNPDWRLRLVQFAAVSPTGDRYAYVLRMDDPAQLAFAQRLAADPTAEFVSHSQTDALALLVGLEVDMIDRSLDTLPLAIMAAPDDRRGVADLKHVTSAHGMPELKRYDHALSERFCELYNAAHPYVMLEDGTPKLKKDGDPWKRTASTVSKTGKAPQDVIAWGFSNIDIDDPIYLVYAGLDALAVLEVAPQLIAETGAPSHLLRTEHWLARQVTRIRARGHRVDRDALEALSATTAAEASAAQLACEEVTGGLRPAQGKALVTWFTDQGVDWSDVPTTKDGNPSLSVSDGCVDLILAQPDLSPATRSAAEAVIRHGHVSNRLTVTKQIRDGIDPRGYLHGELLSIGTVTGRMSARSPNMQNFAKKDLAMRGLFLPEPGCVFISTDFAQIELRVLAALAGEDRMIQTILDGGDLHQLTADLLGITRSEAKTVNFLIVYGGGGGKLAAGIHRPVEECAQIIRDYWAQYPAITEFKNDMAGFTTELRLISGRRVPVAAGREYANLNYQIQGSARELLVGAMRRFSHGDPERERLFWMLVHDEIVTQVPEAKAEQISHEIQEAMRFDFFGVPIDASSDILLDATGTSRWMSGDAAVAYRELAAA